MKITPSRVVLCVAIAALFSVSTPIPALAEPPPSVPDDGSRPDAGESGGLDAGDGPDSGPGIGRGPYATKIAERTRSVADLGARTTTAEETAKLRHKQLKVSRQTWIELGNEAQQTTELAADMAVAAYQTKAAQIPGLTDKFKELFVVNPNLLNLDRRAVVQEAEKARSDAAVAKASLDAAKAAKAIAQGEHKKLSQQLDTKTAALEKLIERNKEAVAAQEEHAEAQNQRNAGKIGTDAQDSRPSEEATRAVKFALKQTGKSYVWGDAGPDTYDCSGLTQSSYGKPGVNLPRIAAEQFRDTAERKVALKQVLPGDLVFYGDTPGNWTSVYHVGMYIGDGMMVHAPRPGDVVKVAPVWFEELVGAHRVVKAIDPLPAKDNKNDEPSPPSETPATKPEPVPEPTPDDDSHSGPGEGNGGPTPTPTPHGG